MSALPIHTIHIITDFASLLIGVQLYLRFFAPPAVKRDQQYWYILGALIGALIGSRLLGALEDPFHFLHPPSIWYYYASKTIIGGLTGGIIGIEISKKLLGIHERTGDSVTVPLIVAIVVGRIGCQLTGVLDGTIGAPCSYWWCFTQGDAYARHPLPLYEIVVLLALLPALYRWIRTKRFVEGFVFRLFIIMYLGLRFFLEFLKEVHPILLGLTAIQLVCAAFVLYYISDIIRHRLYLRSSISREYDRDDI